MGQTTIISKISNLTKFILRFWPARKILQKLHVRGNSINELFGDHYGSMHYNDD